MPLGRTVARQHRQIARAHDRLQAGHTRYSQLRTNHPNPRPRAGEVIGLGMQRRGENHPVQIIRKLHRPNLPHGNSPVSNLITYLEPVPSLELHGDDGAAHEPGPPAQPPGQEDGQ
jgi:hypothetical protein